MTQKVSDYLIKWGADQATGMSEALSAAELARLAEPRDETETLATCPLCRLMGHHAVEVRTFRARRLPGARPGEWIDASTFGDPADGTRVVRRMCMFCGHEWDRS